MDFFKTGFLNQLIHFLLAAAAHYPVRAACLVAGQCARNHFELRMPRLSGVNQVAARFNRIAEAVERVQNQIVVGKQFMQAGNDAQRRTGLQILIIGAVVGIDLITAS